MHSDLLIVRFHVDAPLMSVTIALAFFLKVARGVAIHDRPHDHVWRAATVR